MQRSLMMRARMVLLALLVAALPTGRDTQAMTGQPAPDPAWLHWDATAKTVHLTIIAAATDTAGGFNFNGYNNGGLIVTVPQGAKVVIAFTNRASVPHSVVVTPLDKHAVAGNFPLAFSGSASPHAETGIAHQATPQTFSFTANKVGAYALVCGVPGHAVAGMWDMFRVATVTRPSLSTAATSGPDHGSNPGPTPPADQGKTGTVEGVVRDATSGQPIAHALVIVGWTTLMRLGETDAYGHYRIANVPVVGAVDAFGFREGYVYYHGRPIAVHAGGTTAYSFKMPRQTFADAKLPHLSGATITPAHATSGTTVTFAVHVKPGDGGPMSAEVFAINGLFGHAVLLKHMGADLYRGTWQIPPDVAPGAYPFAFVGAMKNCLENAAYPRETLTIDPPHQ